jgi:hypothetical protein
VTSSTFDTRSLRLLASHCNAEVLSSLVTALPRPAIIGLAGPKGCGKSTIAEVLEVSSLGVVRHRFAGPLKRMAAALGLTYEQIDGAEKELPCELLGGLTPRYLMQTLGTQWGRDMISPDLWVNACMHEIDAAQIDGERVSIIDDVRFDNEADAIHVRGGVVIEIVRAGAAYDPNVASERGLRSSAIDYMLVNDGTPMAAAIDVLLTVHDLIAQAQSQDANGEAP